MSQSTSAASTDPAAAGALDDRSGSPGTDGRALAALALGAAAIAWAPIFFRLSEIGPVASAFWRVALALPFLLAWRLWERRDPAARPGPRSWKDAALLFATGAFFAGDLAFWHWSLTMTTVANATLFANAAPIFVTLVGWMLFGRRFKALFLIGLATSMAGAAILMGSSVQLGRDHLVGDLMGLVTALWLAGYLLAVERMRDRFSTATIMVWNAFACAVLLGPLALMQEAVLAPSTIQGWLVLLALAVVSHAGGQSLIAYSMALLPAAFTAVSLLLQPMLAALFAWAVLGEGIGPLQVAGGIVILAGIVLSRKGSR